MMQKLIPSLFFIICSLFSYSQNVGIGTNTPHASAALEIQDSSRGILIPRMTKAQRIALQNPAEGLMVYQTDSESGFWYRDGSRWLQIVNKQLIDTIYSPLIENNTVGNFSVVSGMDVPNFLNNFGDGTDGNAVLTNGTVIQNLKKYKNLYINQGVEVLVNPAITTILYVQDTLFLKGIINGKGRNVASYSMNQTSNHVGATSSGIELRDPPSNTYGLGNGGSGFSFTWTVNQQPSTFYNFGGSITKNSGANGSWSPCLSGNGSNFLASELLQIAHFGLDISGGNGMATACGCSAQIGAGEGGGGLYIIARNIVLTGTINLSGGNGGYLVCPCGTPAYWATSGAAGGGSCIIRTKNIISNSGIFISSGGYQTAPYNCNKKGGDGAMILIK
jgi:hypothetical protein